LLAVPRPPLGIPSAEWLPAVRFISAAEIPSEGLDLQDTVSRVAARQGALESPDGFIAAQPAEQA
jgi:hypothetical protein